MGARWFVPSLVAAIVFAGCSRESGPEISSPDELAGRRVAIVLASSYAEYFAHRYPELVACSYNDCASAVEALKAGKVDAMPTDVTVARQWSAQSRGALRYTRPFMSDPYGYFMRKGSPLKAKIDAILREFKADGTIERVMAKWCDAEDLSSVEPEPVGAVAATGTLRVAVVPELEPMVFMRNGEIVGSDVDLVRLVAARLGMRLEFLQVSIPALVPAVESGKADLAAGGISITPARAEKVDFTVGYYDAGGVLLIRSTAESPIRTAADLKGKTVAHMSSNQHREELIALQPDVGFAPYSEYAFAVESLRKRKIDAISLGRTLAEIWMAKYPGEFTIAFDYADDKMGFLLPKGSPYLAKLNVELNRMRESGETDVILGEWIEAAKTGVVPALPVVPPPPAGAPVVKVAAAAQAEPWCFVANNEVSGADLAIVLTAASRLGWKVETKVFSWGGMVDAVNGHKTDIGIGGIYTVYADYPTVDATVPYADQPMCLLVRDPGWRAPTGFSALLASLKASFIRTFVNESRWRMMLRGFGVTLLVTFLSALLGTVLAFPVWLARTSKVKIVAALAKGYISALQGTPVLVLLMVLFYLVFGNVDIDGLWVAVIGFGLNLSAYAGEMLRSGVDSIPRGQTEAALALGYAPRRAFTRFVLPQAVKAILPVYRGELIGLLKMTSIVGYIAINDLTKASDLIRSRTYESFFPILTTAFIYFVASWLLAAALERLGRRLDPAFRRNR